jgi:hypothetical protein
MTTFLWAVAVVLSLGGIWWLVRWIRLQLFWAEAVRANDESEDVALIARTSNDPLAAMIRELDSPVVYRRGSAAEQLVTLGTREAAEVLCKALESDDEFVRHLIVKALRSSNALKDDFKQVIFDSVALGLRAADFQQATPEGDYTGFGCEDIIHLLPNLDRQRAIAELTKPGTLRVDHPNLREIIMTLTHLRAVLDDRVFDWLALLRPCVAEGRRGVTGRSAMVYGQLLKAAAFKGHPKTVEWIDDLFRHRESIVEWSALEGAAEAAAILTGLSRNLPEDLRNRVQSQGFESLSLAEKHFAAVCEMEMLIEIYGMGSYVMTSPNTAMALEGLTAMDEHYMRSRLQCGIELWEQKKGTLDEAGTRLLSESIDDIPMPKEVKYQSLRMLSHLYAARNAESFRDKL